MKSNILAKICPFCRNKMEIFELSVSLNENRWFRAFCNPCNVSYHYISHDHLKNSLELFYIIKPLIDQYYEGLNKIYNQSKINDTIVYWKLKIEGQIKVFSEPDFQSLLKLKAFW